MIILTDEAVGGVWDRLWSVEVTLPSALVHKILPPKFLQESGILADQLTYDDRKDHLTGAKDIDPCR